MRVKRYIVDSMPEALEKIRVDIGKDAIILNTKQIKTGGFLGMFGKQQIEVIAAVDEKAVEREKVAPPARQPDAMQRPSNSFVAKQAYQRTAPSRLLPDEPDVERTSAPPAKFPVPQTAVEDEQQVPAQAQAQGSSIANELRDMREMFQKLLLLKEANNNLPDSVLAIRERLLQQEVNEEIVAQIMKNLLLRAENPIELTADEAYYLAKEIIEAMLQKATAEPVQIDHSVKYAFFFGPTGVGKTTTIAKLAAECMLRQKRRIGFITTDTYRIAAVEQLKIYANILNVPLEVVFSAKEIPQAMERLSECDLIFIDTAGRNFRNDVFVQGIRELLQLGESSVNYLVLGLTAKYPDIKAIITNFSDVPISQAIFTKADETDIYGALLNVTQMHSISLSYITNGQNVPDDIAVVTAELITKMILGDDLYA